MKHPQRAEPLPAFPRILGGFWSVAIFEAVGRTAPQDHGHPRSTRLERVPLNNHDRWCSVSLVVEGVALGPRRSMDRADEPGRVRERRALCWWADHQQRAAVVARPHPGPGQPPRLPSYYKTSPGSSHRTHPAIHTVFGRLVAEDRGTGDHHANLVRPGLRTHPLLGDGATERLVPLVRQPPGRLARCGRSFPPRQPASMGLPRTAVSASLSCPSASSSFQTAAGCRHAM